MQQIEQQYPGSTDVVISYVGYGDGNYKLESRFEGWPKRSVTALGGTELGAENAGVLILISIIGSDGEPADPFDGVTLEDVADALLYLGPREELTLSSLNPASKRPGIPYSTARRDRDTGPKIRADARTPPLMLPPTNSSAPSLRFC